MEIRELLVSILGIISIIFSSCKDDKDGNGSYHERLISIYHTFSNVVEDTNSTLSQSYISVNFLIDGSISEGNEYDSLSTYYKDLSFRSRIDEYYSAVCNQLDSLSVVSDSDFDEKHTNGTSLNDLVTIKMRSFYNYTSNNYADWNLTSVNKKLSELTESDCKAIDSRGFNLEFPATSPLDKEHNLTLTFYFKNKEPIVIKRKMIFE